MKNDNLIYVATLAATLITTSLCIDANVDAMKSSIQCINAKDVDLAIKELASQEEVSTEEITTTEEVLEEENSEVIEEQQKSILIDSMLFNNTQVRLNTEIYDITNGIYNEEHIVQDFGTPNTNLARSYLENINPVIPISTTVNETGAWADTRYTWSSAIYSKLLRGAGVDLNRLHIEQVNVDTYVVNGLCTYYGCGTNCTADVASHYHTIGQNDCDSLGPLQILRHYVEGNNYISYDCGATVVDLMDWDDNVQYFTHTQSKLFMSEDNWNKNYIISSAPELVALMAVAHNTGTAFLSNKNDAGSLWHNSSAVYDYCKVLGSQDAINVMSHYVDDWWVGVVEAQNNGNAFSFLGQGSTSMLDNILEEIGVNKSLYAKSFEHKQYYPLRAVLNYLCMERLYYSGGE